MPSPTLRPVWAMPSPTDWIAPPTAEPAPATVVSTAVQTGSRRPMFFGRVCGGLAGVSGREGEGVEMEGLGVGLLFGLLFGLCEGGWFVGRGRRLPKEEFVYCILLRQLCRAISNRIEIQGL